MARGSVGVLLSAGVSSQPSHPSHLQWCNTLKLSVVASPTLLGGSAIYNGQEEIRPPNKARGSEGHVCRPLSRNRWFVLPFVGHAQSLGAMHRISQGGVWHQTLQRQRVELAKYNQRLGDE